MQRQRFPANASPSGMRQGVRQRQRRVRGKDSIGHTRALRPGRGRTRGVQAAGAEEGDEREHEELFMEVPMSNTVEEPADRASRRRERELLCSRLRLARLAAFQAVLSSPHAVLQAESRTALRRGDPMRLATAARATSPAWPPPPTPWRARPLRCSSRTSSPRPRPSSRWSLA